MRQRVKVVIPLYKSVLNYWERAALDNTTAVLGEHPMVLLVPEDLELTELAAAYPRAEVLRVTTEWLGLKNGIAGYNRMMMSKAFYDLFADTEYILICHFDAWIFCDELLAWCDEGYDLVAAPWPKRPRYEHFPLKQYLWLRKHWFAPRSITRTDMFGRIGNGGLCLRRVSAFAEACERYAAEAGYFLSHPGDLHNEDLFWALVPKEFRYPAVEVALRFSFDLKPDVCYALNHHRLPMGCHGFMHRRRVGFWKPFIPVCSEKQ